MARYDPAAWPQHFGVFHQLTFIYLYFAGISDGDLDDEEASVIFETMGNWGYTYTGNELTETVEFWSEHLDGPVDVYFYDVCRTLRTSMDVEQRRRIFSDLAKIARADGRVVPGEESMLSIMQRELDLLGEID